MELQNQPWRTRNGRTEHTGLEGILEQLIEHGADDMANIFARMFELAMRIERERFLGADHYEHTTTRRGYTNGSKPRRIDTPAGTGLRCRCPRVPGMRANPFTCNLWSVAAARCAR